MRSFHQMLRRPIKTAVQMLLMTAAVAVLCICLGQSIAAAKLEANLDDLFTSVALITNKQQISSVWDAEQNRSWYKIQLELPEELTDWIDQAAEQYPNIVEQIHRAGLASAYVPELRPDQAVNYFVDMTTSTSGVEESYYQQISGERNNNPHRVAMLQIRLEQMGQPRDTGDGVALNIGGTVEAVLGLEESYADPVGFTARMELRVANQEALNRLNLTIGESYLVYTSDYYDLDWQLRSEFALELVDNYDLGNGVRKDGSTTLIDRFDPERLVWLIEEERLFWLIDQNEMAWYESIGNDQIYFTGNTNVAYYTYEEQLEDGSVKVRAVTLDTSDFLKYRSVSFTVENLGTTPGILRLEGSWEEFLARETELGILDYTDCSIPTAAVVGMERYQAGANPQLWQTYLDCIDYNTHAFPVVGVENLMAIGDFALERAWISQGRNFTAQELSQGARVCLISEQVAALNGLGVGATITPQFYSGGTANAGQPGLADGVGVINPNAALYGPGAQLEDGTSYTIVGLYNKDTLWQNASSMYEFTPNTIFVPKSSVAVEMEQGTLGIFQSILLKNGRMEEFEAIAIRDGHDGQFQLGDQGYAQVKENLHNYSKVAQQAVAVGLGVYGAILGLFLILVPSQERKNIKIMDSLGATRREKLAHLMAVCLGILVPGTLTGLGMGTLLWGRVVAELTESADAVLQLELDVGTLAGIALAQLVLAAGLALGVCLPMLRSRGLKASGGLIRRMLGQLTRTRLKGSTVVVFAGVVSLVLCGLHQANLAEVESYEQSYQNAPVKVTLVTLGDYDAYHLQAGGFIRDLFTDERFESFTPQKYLKDLQLISALRSETINEEWRDIHMEVLLPEDQSIQVIWEPGYDGTVLAEAEPILIVPEGADYTDVDASRPGIQLDMSFAYNVVLYSQRSPYQVTMTVAGTHDGDGVYCTQSWLAGCMEELEITRGAEWIEGQCYMVASVGENITGITSQAWPLNLTAQRDCQFTWMDGCSMAQMDGTEPVVIVPENRVFQDWNPDVPGIQIQMRFQNYVENGYDEHRNVVYRQVEYLCEATIIATYTNSIQSQEIYCAFEPLERAGAAVSKSMALDHISATLKNNDEIAQLRAMADQWFADPNQELDVTRQYEYALDINDATLTNLKLTLNNSIRMNQICTLLVFVLTAGAGFFLGFLMVRGRKREIILMRTLGRPNSRVYLEFARDQMLWAGTGVFLGGVLFRWQPAERLTLFLGIYFVGLSGALILFLRSTLITSMKEAD